MDPGRNVFLSQIGMDGWDGKSQFSSPDNQGLLANVEVEQSKFPLPDFDVEIEALLNTFMHPLSDDILDFPCGLDAPFIHEGLLYQGPVTQLAQHVNQLSADENEIAPNGLDCETPMLWQNEAEWKDTFAAFFTPSDLSPHLESMPTTTYVALPVVCQDSWISLAGVLSDEDQKLEQIRAYLMDYTETGMVVETVQPALSIPSGPTFPLPDDLIPVAIPVKVTTIEPKSTRRAISKPPAPRTKKAPACRTKKPRTSKKMTERKRHQNKTAATRYRSKKRQQEDKAMEIHQGLLQEKERLVAIQEDLKKNIWYAIRLMEGKLKKAKR